MNEVERFQRKKIQNVRESVIRGWDVIRKKKKQKRGKWKVLFFEQNLGKWVGLIEVEDVKVIVQE